MALGLGEPEKVSKLKRKPVPPSSSKEHLKKGSCVSTYNFEIYLYRLRNPHFSCHEFAEDNDLIFSLEEDIVFEDTTGAAAVAAATSAASATSAGSKLRPKSPHHPFTHRHSMPPKLRHVS